MDATPTNLSETDRRQVERLLTDARQQPTLAARMKLISARLLGLPYLKHPLIGSPTEPEQFVARLDGFDCVTYVEIVLALSAAKDVNGFLDHLRALRYANGEVAYATRLHYTTDWHRANIQRGWLRDLTQGTQTRECAKLLDMVPGIPPHAATLRYFPKDTLATVAADWQDGDLIYFVSGRRALDTNHMGILFRVDGQLHLRHASQHHGAVVEQPLTEFVRTNQMIGFILARPLEAR